MSRNQVSRLTYMCIALVGNTVFVRVRAERLNVSKVEQSVYFLIDVCNGSLSFR
jgi:hypothetical protein